MSLCSSGDLTSDVRMDLLRAQEGPVGSKRPGGHHAELSCLAAQRLVLRALDRARVGACMPKHGVRLKAGLLDGPSSHPAPCNHGLEKLPPMTERPLSGAKIAACDLI